MARTGQEPVHAANMRARREMRQKARPLKDHLMAGVILLVLVLTACGKPAAPTPTPIASQTIALTAQDFTHAVNTLAAEPVTTEDLFLVPGGYSLGQDDDVKRSFDNGFYTNHLSLSWEGAEGWVLSFTTLEAAKRAFAILAAPSRGRLLAEDRLVSTGERELLPWAKIGDESRVFDYEISEILSST